MPRRFTEEKRGGIIGMNQRFRTGKQLSDSQQARLLDYAQDAIADLDEANARLEKAGRLLIEWGEITMGHHTGYKRYDNVIMMTNAFLAEDKEEANPELPDIPCPACNGVGKILKSRIPGSKEYSMEYWLEPCEICHGTGIKKPEPITITIKCEGSLAEFIKFKTEGS